jgi:hypothetical protein
VVRIGIQKTENVNSISGKTGAELNDGYPEYQQEKDKQKDSWQIMRSCGAVVGLVGSGT